MTVDQKSLSKEPSYFHVHIQMNHELYVLNHVLCTFTGRLFKLFAEESKVKDFIFHMDRGSRMKRTKNGIMVLDSNTRGNTFVSRFNIHIHVTSDWDEGDIKKILVDEFGTWIAVTKCQRFLVKVESLYEHFRMAFPARLQGAWYNKMMASDRHPLHTDPKNYNNPAFVDAKPIILSWPKIKVEHNP
jgi:hypothetical protein